MKEYSLAESVASVHNAIDMKMVLKRIIFLVFKIDFLI